ncbi:MAG: ABC transporter ATP-binding protein [Ruminococcaceae bacterium]|nr:ABC transporter ATP-binding protein [Oscillospiraceae bacterium]MBQ4047668.1 ABC transporter ATP-binding protein [Clostridia bacterium]
MICAEQVTMKFGQFTALDHLQCSIPRGCVYGLVGSNGAGKSTFMRLIAGVYRPYAGQVTVEGVPVYDSPEVKEKVVFVPDDLFFLPHASMDRMAELYEANYAKFNRTRYAELSDGFGLDRKANIGTFSKGMRRQAAIILALSTMPDYILFDETFDGLDPVMRNLVRKVIYGDVEERNATAVISSHSLRDLEDTCDQLALLHKGGLIFESDIENLKTNLFKVQFAFAGDYDKHVLDGVEVLSWVKKGSVANAIVRGDREAVRAKLTADSPLLLDILPLTLEEIFIHEMEALGYAFHDVL